MYQDPNSMSFEGKPNQTYTSEENENLPVRNLKDSQKINVKGTIIEDLTVENLNDE